MTERGVLLERTAEQVVTCVEAERNVKERLEPSPVRCYSEIEIQWFLHYLVTKVNCQRHPGWVKVSFENRGANP